MPPFRLPTPQGPPAPGQTTNPFGIPSGLTTGSTPLVTRQTQPQFTTVLQSAAAQQNRRRLPVPFGPPAPPVKSVFGQALAGPPAPTTTNPFGIPAVPWQNSYEYAANAGMAGVQKPNIFGMTNGFLPPAGKEVTGLNESRMNPYWNPETKTYQTEPYYDLKFTKLSAPLEIATYDAETPSWTMDTVKFYDPTIDNQDEAIKAWYADPNKTYLLPGSGYPLAEMTQEQWDAVNKEAPAGYTFTPWGWMSLDYLDSLTATTSDGYGYDYGSPWGGGGGGSRTKMDQFYFGLMNWGI